VSLGVNYRFGMTTPGMALGGTAGFALGRGPAPPFRILLEPCLHLGGKYVAADRVLRLESFSLPVMLGLQIPLGGPWDCPVSVGAGPRFVWGYNRATGEWKRDYPMAVAVAFRTGVGVLARPGLRLVFSLLELSLDLTGKTTPYPVDLATEEGPGTWTYSCQLRLDFGGE